MKMSQAWSCDRAVPRTPWATVHTGMCHLSPSELFLKPAALKARGDWRLSQEQRPRANRFLITAYSASFCSGLDNGQSPQNTLTLLPACSQLILGIDPCLTQGFYCNQRSCSKLSQPQAPLCSGKLPKGPPPTCSPPVPLPSPSDGLRPGPPPQRPPPPAWSVPQAPSLQMVQFLGTPHLPPALQLQCVHHQPLGMFLYKTL